MILTKRTDLHVGKAKTSLRSSFFFLLRLTPELQSMCRNSTIIERSAPRSWKVWSLFQLRRLFGWHHVNLRTISYFSLPFYFGRESVLWSSRLKHWRLKTRIMVMLLMLDWFLFYTLPHYAGVLIMGVLHIDGWMASLWPWWMTRESDDEKFSARVTHVHLHFRLFP